MISTSENDVTQTSAELLTIKDVAALLQVSTKQVRRLIESRELTHYRIGRLYRVAADDLKAFLALRRNAR